MAYEQLQTFWKQAKGVFCKVVSHVRPRNIVATSAGTAIMTTTFAVLFNATEEIRMVRAIEQNLLWQPSVRQDQIDTELLPIDFPDIVRNMKEPYGFSCIVGPKGTGKSWSLDAIGYATQTNVVKIKTGPRYCGNINHLILARLHGQIWHLPLWLNWTRMNSYLSSSDLVTRVFERVKRRTNVPVTVLFDIDTTAKEVKDPVINAHIHVPSYISGYSTDGKLQAGPSKLFSFNATQFTKEVKFLADDEMIMRCLIVASEGLLFQDEAAREPRLSLFQTRELPIDAAKEYLKKYHQIENVNELHLKKFPRTFSKLKNYAKASDKEAYVMDSFDGWKQKVVKLDDKHKKLLLTALTKKDIGGEDYQPHLSEEDVRKMVSTNLLFMKKSTRYEIQFDVVREVLKPTT